MMELQMVITAVQKRKSKILPEYSAVWLAHLLWEQRVTGSNPVSPTNNGGLAQLGERLLCKQNVIGSIPVTSTISSPLLPIYSFVLGSITGTVNVYTVRQVDRCQGN
jgi:hypothetical protein